MVHTKVACQVAAALMLPIVAHASFGGGAPCRDFGCNFVILGLLVGTVGVPLCGGIFGLLHVIFCNRQRSKINQFFVGAFIGMAVFEIAAVVAALTAATQDTSIGARGPSIAFTVVFLVAAVSCAFYARSAPRSVPRPATHDP